ncbi:TfoX/Sxy family protein [Aureisphaera galaxeae]|uniref:TfoX/Sxy family protein n=1 Tax=Aureisphaera galaxeae TaxID=1538023 RepID=UPI002350FE3A|nr:TfoX/Sxy family protein [Aureisphaera galaxeae]MDC8003663.1 TfoX/Sxy family protein [Aureisphaera galaxeae]
MAVSEEYAKFVEDQLSEFGPVDMKRMFGGIGIFREGLMFGKIGSDIFRLKVDETNQKEYEENGMKPYYSEKKKKGMPYWEVPQEVLEDRTLLAEWAGKSFEIAKKAAAKKKK